MEKKRTYPPLTAYRVTYNDGHSEVHDMAAHVTLQEATDHYVGQRFTLADERSYIVGVGVATVTPPSQAYRVGDTCPDCGEAVLEDEERRSGVPQVGCPACGHGFVKYRQPAVEAAKGNEDPERWDGMG